MFLTTSLSSLSAFIIRDLKQEKEQVEHNETEKKKCRDPLNPWYLCTERNFNDCPLREMRPKENKEIVSAQLHHQQLPQILCLQ